MLNWSKGGEISTARKTQVNENTSQRKINMSKSYATVGPLNNTNSLMLRNQAKTSMDGFSGGNNLRQSQSLSKGVFNSKR